MFSGNRFQIRRPNSFQRWKTCKVLAAHICRLLFSLWTRPMCRNVSPPSKLCPLHILFVTLSALFLKRPRTDDLLHQFEAKKSTRNLLIIDMITWDVTGQVKWSHRHFQHSVGVRRVSFVFLLRDCWAHALTCVLLDWSSQITCVSTQFPSPSRISLTTGLSSFQYPCCYKPLCFLSRK